MSFRWDFISLVMSIWFWEWTWNVQRVLMKAKYEFYKVSYTVLTIVKESLEKPSRSCVFDNGEQNKCQFIHWIFPIMKQTQWLEKINWGVLGITYTVLWNIKGLRENALTNAGLAIFFQMVLNSNYLIWIKFLAESYDFSN